MFIREDLPPQARKTRSNPSLFQDGSQTSVTHTLDCLRVVSYNCRGWKSGSNYVQSLLQSCDICLIQEHWLLRENLNSLIISDDFVSVGVSGMDSSILLSGRPFGGCGILYCKSLSSVVRRLFTDSKRFCAISITLNNSCDNSPFVILNYMVLSLQNILTISSLLVILMLIFHVLGPIVLIYPHSCCRTISSLLIKCLTLTLPTTMMFIHAVPLLITFLLYLTMPISLILFLFLILSRISLTTYPYTSLSNFLTFSHFLLIHVRRSIIVLLVTLTLLPTLQLTGLKSPHGMFHLTVTKFCPPYLNFLQISLIAVTQTALVTTLILTPTVCNFLTVLLLQLIYAFRSTINVSGVHLFLVGMLQPNTSNSLLTFGTKFGLNVVAPPLVF